MSGRPHQIIVRVTDEANDALRKLAKHHRLPIGTVARGMMERGYRPWVEDRRAK